MDRAWHGLRSLPPWQVIADPANCDKVTLDAEVGLFAAFTLKERMAVSAASLPAE
jgi:hypothetical protein